MQNEHSNAGHGHDNLVEVAVHTTSGSLPQEGYDQHNANQPIRQALQKAEHEYHITDTTGWVALVNEQRIDPDQTYAAVGLNGKIDIDWGPEEGGGGCMS